MIKRASIFIFLFIAIAGSSCTVLRENDYWPTGVPWREKDSWYTGFFTYPWVGDDSGWIFSELILPVPNSRSDNAIRLLSDVPVVRLDIEKAEFILDQRNLNPEILLEVIVMEEEREAERLEKRSTQLPSEDISIKMKNLAKEHRHTAERARSLKGKLYPYLVRAVVLNESTGTFSSYVKDDELWIMHFQLERGPAPMKKYPLVIFLENQPSKVYTEILLAE
jgi:hypothetical protein